MTAISFLRSATLGLGLLVAAGTAAAASATAPEAFVAKYEVLKDGSPLGEATLSLKAMGNNEFEYSNKTKGTSGLAAMLGANVDHSSRFRWTGTVPEALTYDYRMQASIKSNERHLKVDWSSKQVSVQDNKKSFSYAAVPGMVERNTLALALGIALRAGKQEITLPVAVKQEVQNQQFKVSGKETVKVPAGSFDALRVDRTDADRGFNAWYVPDRYPVPVKLAQKDGGNFTMQLISYSKQ
jgi:hypothetical protein